MRVKLHLDVVKPIELYAPKLTYGFQQAVVHLSSSWLVGQVGLVSCHFSEQGFDT